MTGHRRGAAAPQIHRAGRAADDRSRPASWCREDAR